MAKPKHLSMEKRAMIVNLHMAGKNNREVAKELKISTSTVSYNLTKFKTSDTLATRKGPGRPRKTTKAQDRQIAAIAKRDKHKSAPDIAIEISLKGLGNVSVTTVKRRLQEAGYRPSSKYAFSSINKDVSVCHYCGHKIIGSIPSEPPVKIKIEQ